ncbi:hypothetical protein [Bacillus sp. UMB0728]|uniref:hypothetical protein n=1 Tax=Bacillus sp. UMB0728 TaxID=2066052 RepID=UPI0015DEC63F|nr:hypothetical protein [Bacillus sp. UMB0728]
MKESSKYFVSCGEVGEFMVIYQDWCEHGGNYWATEKDGFNNETDAQDYADKLNATKM